ncbi:hypothetical protein CAPTEDRAFT_193937 [Capitella teleta]|uniref:CUB domain-containing protein n=1 Tax=Capitella teleta TaxID=283909 RepID=R7TJH7_CAPTE|nr:hypothetical protein CAPTEDRAFT_193937 [Capitella teleta]|eukprot:ELT93834.1 hypothetical protein CAPTEDRAFT_193937 [Capitella teleta]
MEYSYTVLDCIVFIWLILHTQAFQGILSMQSCSTISVNRQMQYLLSKDIWDLHCFYDLEQNVNVELSSENNLKIAINMQRVAGSVQTSSSDEVMVQYGDGDSIALREETLELETDHLTLTLTSMQSVLLIGFKAFGCDNPATPAYAWVSREGDVATIGCYHSEYEWKLSCVGSKWIGSRSNCTDKQQDILFALIIGLTILLCAIVITIGYVCLKRSKYTYEAKSSPYEMTSMMSDPSNPGTWQKAKLQGNNDTLILPVNSLQGQTLQLR